MSGLLQNPKHWRDRAEEARTRAAQLDDPIAQQTMYEIAAGYDRMAELASVRPMKPTRDTR